MEGEVKGKTYKMKGHTLPGINQRSDATTTNVAEQGLAGSSVFQQVPPLGVQQPFTPPVGGAGAMGVQQRNPNPLIPGGGVGATGAPGAGMGIMPGPPFKPSMAKIFGAKGKRKPNPDIY